MKLYKYAGVSGARELFARRAIVDRELYFASPAAFNDPFECRFTYSMQATLQEWRRFCSRPIVAASLGYSAYTPPTDEELRGWAARAPEHVAWLTRAFRRELEEATGILCLSARCDDILMWSHYAESHRGICLEFTPTARSFLQRAQAVRYQDEYPIVNFVTLPQDDWVRLVYATKSAHWSYEEEWRVLAVAGGAAVQRYEPGDLTSIILGSNASRATESMVRECVSLLDHPVGLFRAVCATSAYRVELQPIS